MHRYAHIKKGSPWDHQREPFSAVELAEHLLVERWKLFPFGPSSRAT